MYRICLSHHYAHVDCESRWRYIYCRNVLSITIKGTNAGHWYDLKQEAVWTQRWTPQMVGFLIDRKLVVWPTQCKLQQQSANYNNRLQTTTKTECKQEQQKLLVQQEQTQEEEEEEELENKGCGWTLTAVSKAFKFKQVKLVVASLSNCQLHALRGKLFLRSSVVVVLSRPTTISTRYSGISLLVQCTLVDLACIVDGLLIVPVVERQNTGYRSKV